MSLDYLRLLYQHFMKSISSRTPRTQECCESTSVQRADQTARHDQDAADPDIATLREEMREAITKIEQLEISERQAAEEKQCHENEIKTLHEHLEDMDSELVEMQRENDSLRERLRDYKAAREDSQRMQKEADDHRRSHLGLQKKHADALALLEARTSELQDAQKYLTRIDIVSDADVLRLLKDLNSLAFQTAAQIADSVPFHGMQTKEERRCYGQQAKDLAAELVGPPMVELLMTQHHDEDSICVQIAVQTCIVAFMNQVINAWTCQDNVDFRLFQTVYAALRKKESQTVAGRWRALSRTHLRFLSDHSTLSVNIENNLVSGITAILLVSGADSTPEKLFDAMKSKFIDRIHAIIQLCLELQKSIGEEVISSDFEPIVALCGRPFDKEKMDDAYSTDMLNHAPKSRNVNVLCTTEMGIQRVERKSEDSEARVVMLLKPKVVLETLIDELQAPQNQISNMTKGVE